MYNVKIICHQMQDILHLNYNKLKIVISRIVLRRNHYHQKYIHKKMVHQYIIQMVNMQSNYILWVKNVKLLYLIICQQHMMVNHYYQ